MAALTSRLGDAWRVETARNLVFSRMKWLPASMWGTSFLRRVRLVLACSQLSALRGSEPFKIGMCCAMVSMDALCPSSIGKYFVQALQYEVVLGRILCKFFSAQ